MVFDSAYLDTLVDDFKSFISCLDLVVLTDLENRGVSDLASFAKKTYGVLTAVEFGRDLGRTTNDDFAQLISEMKNMRANYPSNCSGSLDPLFVDIDPVSGGGSGGGTGSAVCPTQIYTTGDFDLVIKNKTTGVCQIISIDFIEDDEPDFLG